MSELNTAAPLPSFSSLLPQPSTPATTSVSPPPAFESSSSNPNQPQTVTIQSFQCLGDATADGLIYYNPLGGPINNIVCRSVKHTLTFIDDGADSIHGIDNPGLSKLKTKMAGWALRLDKSLATTLRSLLATHHIDRFFSLRDPDANYDESEGGPLRRFVHSWYSEVLIIQNETSNAAKDLRKLLESPSDFEPTASLSRQDDKLNHDTLILETVKADIARCYADTKAPEHCDQIVNSLANSAGICTDFVDLSDWWTFLASRLFEITQEDDISFLDSLKESLPLIFNYIAPYVSQIKQTLKETENSAFEYRATRTVIKAAEHNLWRSPDHNGPASLDWRYLLDTCSIATVIANPITIDVGGTSVTHLVTSRITSLVRLESGHYGIQMRILAGEQTNDGGNPDLDLDSDTGEVAPVNAMASLLQRPKRKQNSKSTYRCTKMKVEWSFEQSHGCSNAAVVAFGPITSNDDARRVTERVQFTSSSDILSIPLPTVSFESSKTVAVPANPSVHCVQLGNTCTWTFRENEKLNGRIVDCDVGVILMTIDPNEMAVTTSELTITLDYETAWKGSWNMKNNIIPTRHHSGEAAHTAKGRSTTIPFRIYSDLKLIKDMPGVSDREFLSRCGLKASER